MRATTTIDDVSSITVRISAVHQHHWEAGRSLYHDPTNQTVLLQYHLWLIQYGEVEVRTEEQHWTLRTGDVILLPLIMTRHIRAIQESGWLSLGLRFIVFNQFDLFQKRSAPIRWHLEDAEYRLLESWMIQIVAAYRQKDSHHRFMIDGLGNAILGLCWPHLSPLPLEHHAHQILPKWLESTLRRIDMEPSLGIVSLAQHAGFSPAQFRRSFHKWIGTAPHKYLQKRRLEIARHLLESTNWPVRSIASHIGLDSATHFSQLFKEVYGLSPSHYRESLESEFD